MIPPLIKFSGLYNTKFHLTIKDKGKKVEPSPAMQINCGEPIVAYFLMIRTWLDEYIYLRGRLGSVGLFHVIVCLAGIWYPVLVEGDKEV